MNINNIYTYNIHIHISKKLIIFQNITKIIKNPPNNFKKKITSHLKQNTTKLILILIITNLFTYQF